MKKELYSVLLLFCLIGVWADTPVDCKFEDIKGLWTFIVGPEGYDNTIDCSLPLIPVRKFQVKLDFPNVASSADGQTGTWTMIYNQGFEVIIGGKRYFAFSKYTSVNGTVTSYCSETMKGGGWVHDDKMLSDNWGCFIGVKYDRLQPSPLGLGGQGKAASGTDTSTLQDPRVMGLTWQQEQERRQRQYVPDVDLVDRINQAQNLWKAAVNPELAKYTIGQLERRAGGYHSSIEPARQQVEQVSIYRRQQSNHDASHPSASRLTAQATIPDHFDWRNVNGVNYVSPVRDQGNCGSCYAFASMATLEARIRILSNNTQQPILSPQHAVSCSQYSQGCDGGFPYLVAGKYGMDFGILEEECYPYASASGVSPAKCQETSVCAKPVRHYTATYSYIGGYYGASTVELMQQEIMANGPIAVSFEVYPDFTHYTSGVYKHTGLLGFNPFVITNHVVVIVGWGVTPDGIPYWIVKNSWGPNWGENGFFRILRGNGQYGGECGIESLTVSITPFLK
eukprot:TRINITY_DN4062_c0_g1_i7.p1 TRINITY_DN4062_c0_g1~~TRINITY_DN4062_c0_g1_i7.p1  ORF type:complete len:526 (+),score=195.00 TRINITY_DN4062_c0_g1_i7:56-1579(+)